MPNTIPNCWPCSHFRTSAKGWSCAQDRQSFPERCEAYEYEPGADMEVAGEYDDEEMI